MSNITRLDVGYDEVGQKILNNVDFPRLEVLHFANEHVEFPKALRPATRSAIQKLSAYATFRNSEALIAFLSTVPNLGTLELHGWDYEVGLVCMAVLAIDSPVLAPQLHTLRIWDVQVTERLVEMIKARRSSSSTLGIAMLRRIVIDCQPSKVICSDATNGLEELVREGLEVQWCDRGS
ncbi:hypothetical protein CPB85DRAFT_1249398 [Mucidula mucida]|nr:hypothetical protein CPB85DRAFT_1249398 [Mucidula mucida]